MTYGNHLHIATPDASAFLESLGSGLGASGVTPAVLGVLAQLQGVAWLVRDDKFRVVWCNESYGSLCGVPAGRLIGSTLRDIMSPAAASEREAVVVGVLASRRPCTYYQFAGDRRMLSCILTLDEEAFGHRGVLVMLREAPVGQPITDNQSAMTLRTPCLSRLDGLSPAELRTLYDLASGRSNAESADRQHRSIKTIQKHVEAIHRKLGSGSRSALVRIATERGIQRFTEEQWEGIIEGARDVRRSERQAVGDVRATWVGLGAAVG